MKNDYVKWLCLVVIVNACTSGYQIYAHAVEHRALLVRLEEVENRIVIQDESRREIQRLALEQMQRKRKETKCQTHSKPQSL